MTQNGVILILSIREHYYIYTLADHYIIIFFAKQSKTESFQTV